MAAIRRFEEALAWHKARELVRAVYAASGSGPFAKDFAMRDQIRRAALSIMSNIAEGFAEGNRKEFARFLDIARGSAAEAQSLSYAALARRTSPRNSSRRSTDSRRRRLR